MSKYQPLSDRLRSHSGSEWRASFSELESVLGFPLPKGAKTGPSWWSADKPHASAWTASGWTAKDIDPAQGAVTFRKSDISPLAVEAAAGLAPVGDIGSMPAPPPTSYSEIEVQPSVMLEAAERASHTMHRNRTIGLSAMVGMAALVLGAGAMVMRRVGRR